jgi:hypothetical protein
LEERDRKIDRQIQTDRHTYRGSKVRYSVCLNSSLFFPTGDVRVEPKADDRELGQAG